MTAPTLELCPDDRACFLCGEDLGAEALEGFSQGEPQAFCGGECCAGQERIDRIRQIYDEHQAAQIEGVLMDAFTASAIVQVFDGLKPKNRALLVKRHPAQVADLTWKVLR